jgi:hypothetical protein
MVSHSWGSHLNNLHYHTMERPLESWAVKINILTVQYWPNAIIENIWFQKQKRDILPDCSVEGCSAHKRALCAKTCLPFWLTNCNSHQGLSTLVMFMILYPLPYSQISVWNIWLPVNTLPNVMQARHFWPFL